MALAGMLALTPASVRADDDVLVEFHFNPVPRAQIAIWLADADGNVVRDVFVTQATGTLGIGNRPGRWDFLSSWRFPYGPRPQVLPVWAHARKKTYPKLVFHDDDDADQNSLGWHENSSSPEPYFCRPLAKSEHEVISTDTMTCPSPSTFQSDKGKFSDETSVYPPRSDLVSFEKGHDHPDVYMLAELNDLDGVTAATPVGNTPEMVTTVLPRELASRGELTAYIEINLEHDENRYHDYDRERDHYVDPRLSGYGIEYLGQPSVVYAVTFDPMESAFRGTGAYIGYGSFDGSTGTIYPPDKTISTEGGSGADRLALYTLNGETFRFGVYSHGVGGGEGEGGWGTCKFAKLPAMTDIELEAIQFDRVRVHFTVPDLGEDTEIRNVRVFYRVGDMELTEENAGSAIQAMIDPDDCGAPLEPGVTTWCEVNELFANTNYQIGIRYEDRCANASEIAAGSITTPAQEFATVEGFCFVATAAWGAPWADKVQALRWFRDLYLRSNAVGSAFVAFYYSYGPAAARAIAPSPYARAVAREVLRPLADLAWLLTHP